MVCLCLFVYCKEYKILFSYALSPLFSLFKMTSEDAGDVDFELFNLNLLHILKKILSFSSCDVQHNEDYNDKCYYFITVNMFL